MARTARDAKLDSRTARLKLAPRAKPYFTSTGKPGVALGYRRLTGNRNGTWVVRRYVGREDGGGRHELEAFAAADDYTDANGDDPSVLTYAQAIERAGGALSLIQNRHRYTVADAVEDYVAWSRLNTKSARDTEVKLRAYLVGYFGERQLAALTAHDFEKWLLWAHDHRPKGRRRAPRVGVVSRDKDAQRRRRATLNRVLNIVKACLNRAHKTGHVPSDDAWRRLRRFKGADAARLQWLTVEECGRLLNACEPDFRRCVELALLSGARWGELRALRVGDYDVRSGTLLVAESKAGRPRRIPLSAEGQQLLESLTAGRDPGQPLLTRADGRPWGQQDQKRPMAAACAAAALKPAVGFHALRHTYASLLVQRGTPLAIVAEALGHSDTRMVSKHYGHLAPSHVADAIRANLPTIGATIETSVVRLRR